MSDQQLVLDQKDIGLNAAKSLFKRIQQRSWMSVIVVSMCPCQWPNGIGRRRDRWETNRADTCKDQPKQD
jgi:hypothetical protein